MLCRLYGCFVVVVRWLMKLGDWRFDLCVYHTFIDDFLLFSRSCIITCRLLSLEYVDRTDELSGSSICRNLVLGLILQLNFCCSDIGVLWGSLLFWNRNSALWRSCGFFWLCHGWWNRISRSKHDSLGWLTTLDYHLACLRFHGLSTDHGTRDIVRPFSTLSEVWALPSYSTVSILN